MPGLFAPLAAVDAVMFFNVILLQYGVVAVGVTQSSVVGGREDGFG
jgi:hypothetical protein